MHVCSLQSTSPRFLVSGHLTDLHMLARFPIGELEPQNFPHISYPHPIFSQNNYPHKIMGVETFAGLLKTTDVAMIA